MNEGFIPNNSFNNQNVSAVNNTEGGVFEADDIDFSFVLASSVHDMKNSLCMLLNSLEEVIEESSTENDAQTKRFSILQYEASRINSELIQLLSIYSVQNKTLVAHIDENFVVDTIEEQIARNDLLFKTQGVELTIDCDSDLAGYYDNDLIGNVVHNVLINAARYANTDIYVSAKIKGGFLVVTIADDGHGFPDAMINAASLESDAHRDGSSTQLGLFFAAKIADLHKQNNKKGYIQLSNGGELGGGVFTIYLP